MSNTPVTAAVGWHDSIAERFNDGYRRSPGFIERYALWHALIDDVVRDGDRVLDAGCGSGVFSIIAAAKAAHVDAIDGSANMVAIASAEQARLGLPNISFRQAMLTDLEASPALHYDAILSSSVLEYVDGYEAVLANFARMLRPGGRLLLSMPNAESLYRKAEAAAFGLTGRPRYFAHVRNVVSAKTLAIKLAAVGLTTQATHYFAEPPLPSVLRALVPTSRRRKTLFVIEAHR